MSFRYIRRQQLGRQQMGSFRSGVSEFGPTVASQLLTTSAGGDTAPSMYYVMQDGTLTELTATVGPNLDVVQGTIANTDVATPYTDGTLAVDFGGTGHYEVATNTDASVAGLDSYFEMTLRLHIPTLVGGDIFAEYGTNTAGWRVAYQGGNRFRAFWETISGNTLSLGPQPDAIWMIIGVTHEDGGNSHFYKNGIDFTNTPNAGDELGVILETFALGGRAGAAADLCDADMAHFGLWKAADLWSGGDRDAVALARYNLLTNNGALIS